MSQPQQSHPIAWSDEEYRNFGNFDEHAVHVLLQPETARDVSGRAS